MIGDGIEKIRDVWRDDRRWYRKDKGCENMIGDGIEKIRDVWRDDRRWYREDKGCVER